MIIEIDSKSGFCFGVVHAVKAAENELAESESLYCLGEIVHNQSEVDRLKDMGLVFINHEEFKQLSNVKVLIRAHGEPPSTYEIAKSNDIELIDASCKVVLSLQRKVKKAYDEMNSVKGIILIYGKSEHPEVIGLQGQIQNKAIVFEQIEDLTLLDFSVPMRMFAQTTMNVHEYEKAAEFVKQKMQKQQQVNFDYVMSVCKQVSNREGHLSDFAKSVDLMLFVGGKNSSNAKFLFGICKDSNTNSKFISDETEIDHRWFQGVERIGISGATSTPMWLLESVKSKIESECI